MFVGSACVVAALLLVRRRWLAVRVVGHSMMPTYADGDHVLVRRRRTGWMRGAIVVGKPPGAHPDDLFVKRLTALEGDRASHDTGVLTVPEGHCWVLGDATRSGDSRVWGAVPLTNLVGVVVRGVPAGVRRDSQSDRHVR